MAKRQKHTRVLFIDPASISSGWAIYADGELKKAGKYEVDKSLHINIRLLKVFTFYSSLMEKEHINEVHIERLLRNTHIYTHYAVGCILCASAVYNIPANADISIKSWQSVTKWAELPKHKQTDDMAAILMGKYFYENLGNT